MDMLNIKVITYSIQGKNSHNNNYEKRLDLIRIINLEYFFFLGKKEIDV
jgi:hypothetical protein